MKTKIIRKIAGILLMIATFISIIGDSVADVQAKPVRCTRAHLSDMRMDMSELHNGQTVKMTICKDERDKHDVSYVYVLSDGFSATGEWHKVTASSSKPSVVRVSVKKKSIYFYGEKCGTATVIIKSSCGNRYKVKVTVKEHHYVYDKMFCCQKCTRCDTLYFDLDGIDEDSVNGMLDELMDEHGMIKIPYENGIEEWKADGYVDWLCHQLYNGNMYFYLLEIAHHVKGMDKVRTGDIVVTKGEYNHPFMVVNNPHDGKTLEIAMGGVGRDDDGDNNYFITVMDTDDEGDSVPQTISYDDIKCVYSFY